jgi:hypothetical protein
MTVLPTANMGWVEGTVADATSGDPLEATIVALGQPYTITTDPDTGTYKLWLKLGRYTLQATAAGYVTETAVVRIRAHKGITQDFDLVRAGAGGLDRHRAGQRPQLAHVLQRGRGHCCRIRAATATGGPQPARPSLPVLVSRRL